MTTPPQPPGEPGWRGRVPTPDPATQRIPRRPGSPQPPDAQTEKLRAPRPPAGPPPTERIRLPQPPAGPPPPRPPAGPPPTERIHLPQPPAGPPPPRPPAPSAGPPQPLAPAPTASPPEATKGRGFLNLRSIILIAVIVVALLAGALAGAELYARDRADGILAEVTQCVVQDGASISFGVNPPFLWQHITGDYTNISVTTDGDRVQDAKGMTAEVTLKDVQLHGTDDSQGTIGSLNATLTWMSAGIKDTVAANLPGVGSLITGVSTDPAAGTIILKAGGSNSVTAKPAVTDGDLNLEVLDVKGPIPKDKVQSALNDLTKKLNDNYPLGIHADSVEVTSTGVVGKFSSEKASIPKEDANPCFSRL